MTVPAIGMALASKTENPQLEQVSATILKSISGGKIISLSDVHGNGLHLQVIEFNSNNLSY